MDGFSEHQMHLFVHKELSLPEKPVATVICGMGFQYKFSCPDPWQIMLMDRVHLLQVLLGVLVCCGQFCQPVTGSWILSLLVTEASRSHEELGGH